MEHGFTLEDTRLERLGKARNVGTPRESGPRRDVQEQVVSSFWGYRRRWKQINCASGSLERTDDVADAYMRRWARHNVAQELTMCLTFWLHHQDWDDAALATPRREARTAAMDAGSAAQRKVRHVRH